MSKPVVFTSITLNYLPKVRVLASTLKRWHPDWRFIVVISDRLSPELSGDLAIDVAEEPFDEILWIDDLGLENMKTWIFKHRVVEISTAIKGPVTEKLVVRDGVEKLIYLDPDIAVFNPLDDIAAQLDEHSILLTPHLLDAEENMQAIWDNEIAGTLRHGSFNFGFYAVANDEEGRKFARWWSHRLGNFCYDDKEKGLFTDQKWGDLIPAFFSRYHILRDAGCNVASWNLSTRLLTVSRDGTILVNGSPLRFYHFTGYDSGLGDMATQFYKGESKIVDEIWAWYNRQLRDNEQFFFKAVKWYFNFYEDGSPVPSAARLLYREREDLQADFPDPFSLTPDGGYKAWFEKNSKYQAAR